MKTKDFREIQISSSLLVFIFLGVLALGVVIFLLGISVGKSQSRIVAEKGTPSHTVTEVLPKEKPIPVAAAEEKPRDVKTAEPAAKPAEKTESAPPAAELKTPQADESKAPPASKSKVETPPKPAARNAFAIQVGAYDDRVSARQIADRFAKRGYTAVVLEPFRSDRKPYFRVWLRGYQNRETAQAALDGLNAAEKRKTDYYLVKDDRE